MEYFRHEIISDRVIRIIDILNNCCYLVIGDNKACLLDTLDGFGDIKAYCKQFTDKEIFVILTHGHLDHVAGCCFFDEVYINHRDEKLFIEHASETYRLNEYSKVKGLQDIAIKDFNPMYKGELKDIEDGQIFDLGNLHIKMILCQGHTRGMMVPLIVEERMIVFGDACGVGVLLLGEMSTVASEYLRSLKKLKTYEDQYDLILRNHGTFTSDKDILDNVIECCEDIISGNVSGQEIEMFGHKGYVVKAMDEHGNRLDGKQGNIKYMEYNAC